LLDGWFSLYNWLGTVALAASTDYRADHAGTQADFNVVPISASGKRKVQGWNTHADVRHTWIGNDSSSLRPHSCSIQAQLDSIEQTDRARPQATDGCRSSWRQRYGMVVPSWKNGAWASAILKVFLKQSTSEHSPPENLLFTEQWQCPSNHRNCSDIVSWRTRLNSACSCFCQNCR